MYRNIVFDISNVILMVDWNDILPKICKNKEEMLFIEKNVLSAPEWGGTIDFGYVSKESAIAMVQERTNHENDELIERFWNGYNDYCYVDFDVFLMMKALKECGYKLYILSNTNEHTIAQVEKFNHCGQGVFDIIDGAVLSNREKHLKPYNDIYRVLLDRYNLNSDETLFIDDKIKNCVGAEKNGIHTLWVKENNYRNIYEQLTNLLDDWKLTSTIRDYHA